MGIVRYRVFSQSLTPHLPLAELTSSADLRVERLEPTPGAPLPSAVLAVARATGGPVATVRLTARPAISNDVHDATAAARQGRAAGMDALAARCPTIIDVDADVAAPEPCYALLATLASITLGPILPPDGRTLLGVRSARALADG